jgi:hypothetical protein
MFAHVNHMFPGTDRSEMFPALAGMRRVSGVFAGEFILLA